MACGFRTLPTLCKAAQRLPTDVVELIKQCLYLNLGKGSPPWLDSLFLHQLQHFGSDSEATLTVCAVRQVDVARAWGWLNAFRKDDTADVTVKFTVYPGGILWDIECRQRGIRILQDCGMSLDCETSGPSISACLQDCRKTLCRLEPKPLGFVEVPNCLYEWRKLLQLWIFGEAEADATCDICLLTPPLHLE